MKFYSVWNYLAFVGTDHPMPIGIPRGCNLDKPSKLYSFYSSQKKSGDGCDTNALIDVPIVNIPFNTSKHIRKTPGADKYNDLCVKELYSPKNTNEDFSLSFYSQPLLSTLSRVFSKENFHGLNNYQKDLFNELCLGKDALINAETSSGKTFAILLYIVLRYFYQIPQEHLKALELSLLLQKINNINNTTLEYQRPIYKNTDQRVFVLCPTKELAIQCAQQIISFSDGNDEIVQLIIDEYDLCPLIGKNVIFVVGSSNQVESYLMSKDKKHVKDLLENAACIVFDEIDRLFKVPGQYASLKKKKLIREHPGSAFNICHTLLSISKRKLQIIGASASIPRPYIRYLNNLVQSYRKNSKNSIAIIRKNKQNNSKPYVSIPSTVQQFYAISDSNSLASKISCLASVYALGESEKSILFLSSYDSLFSLQFHLKKLNIDCKILHHELGIKDNIPKLIPDYKREASTNTVEMYNNVRNEMYGPTGDGSLMLIASIDSARGLHIPLVWNQYIKIHTFSLILCISLGNRGHSKNTCTLLVMDKRITHVYREGWKMFERR